MKRTLYFSIAALLVSCAGEGDGTEGDESTETSSVINPPFEGDFQNDTIFKIDPTKETLVSTPNGSSIEIPANVIVDKDGNPVTSEVELSFTQYHSMADILASGIPMEYDSAGTEGTFESAGMFTLKAKSDGKDVFIKDGSEIGVNLASDTPEPYNFYSLNEQNGDWTYDFGPDIPVSSNPNFDPSRFPLEPQEADKNAFVLDLYFDLSDYSELSDFSGIVWEYVGNHDTLDPRKNKVVATTVWEDFELEPTYNAAFEYYLTFIKGDLTFVTKVRAALQGDNYAAAIANYQERRKEVAAEIDYLQKPFVRAVKIQGFGTYNHDRLWGSDADYVKADFDFGDEHNDFKDRILVFTYFPGINALWNYPQKKWGNFPVSQDLEQKIIAVLPDNYIATCESDLSEVDGQTEFEFKMKVHEERLEEKSNLDEIMANL